MQEASQINHITNPAQTKLWVTENRLPNDAEIKERKQKFPSTDEEAQLRKLFFERMKPQIRPWLSQIHSDGQLRYAIRDIYIGSKRKKDLQQTVDELSDNQIELIAGYLYGIYFYNLISGGRLMNPDLNYEQSNKAEVKVKSMIPEELTDPVEQYRLIMQNRGDALKSDNLDDWPLKVYSGILDDIASARADIAFNIINIILERFEETDPHKLTNIQVHRGHGILKRDRLSYRSSVINEWIRSGIEEASHVDFSNLRRSRYERRTGKSGALARNNDYYHGPLAVLGDRKTILREISGGKNPGALIDYNALLSEEFAAHVVQAVYTQRYDRVSWNSGYREYDQAVRKRRGEALA